MARSTVVKSSPSAIDSYPAEAAGLDWLADARGARIARVIEVSPSRIELERIDPAPATVEHAVAFGASLARTHAAGADAFGSPPPGWSGRLYIGRREMPPAAESAWGRFYVRDRVLPFLDVAVRAGNVTDREAEIIRAACEPVSEGAFDDDEPPARIHGDLWSGNVLWSSIGVVLIDPAAHGGHRETDLAMLDLFGCPFLDDILEGYGRAAPLRPGWRDRVPLHQLHPLAVHAAGHGRSYGRALVDAAQRVAALTG
ncbi:fructosamine kinase family protein [Labedella endophytica]|uniref:Fructosamine kinase n=1 Tax=Labedella endophytica TaxID=1523160 RepID=A0A3S1CS61_9MICO|nr:fructosamine kinase family protein [Labedella endophytica]RUR01094.1 fructosamine kinase [Labedella endophytica]